MATANRMRALNRLPYDFEDGLKIAGVDVTTLNQISTANGAGLVGFTPVGNLGSTTVQAAIQELDTKKTSAASLAGSAGATAVGFSPVGGISSTNVQAALAELDSEKASKAELSGASGASLVGYRPAGTGAVATTVQSKLHERVSPVDQGAVGDGSADDTEAFKKVEALNTRVVDLAGKTYAVRSIWANPVSGVTLKKDYVNGELIVDGRVLVFDKTEGASRSGASKARMMEPSTNKKLGLYRADQNNYYVWRPLGGQYWQRSLLTRSSTNVPFNWAETYLKQVFGYICAQDAGVTYAGGWATLNGTTGLSSNGITSYISGRARQSIAVGDFVQITYTGGGDLYVIFVGRTRGNYVNVLLDNDQKYLTLPDDGNGNKYFDSYTATDLQFKQIVRIASDVPNGTHTIRLSVSALKNPASTGDGFVFNAISFDSDEMGPWKEQADAPLWAPGQTILQSQVRKSGERYYYAAADGTTGATAPTHTSGSVSDGGVTWVYRAASGYDLLDHRIQAAGSQLEYAYEIKPAGATSKEDVGGALHGNETQNSFSFYVSNVPTTLADFEWRSGSSVAVRESITATHSQIGGGATPVVLTTLRRTFTRQHVDVYHKHELQMAAEVGYFYSHMWPLVHWDAAGYKYAARKVWSPCDGDRKFSDFYGITNPIVGRTKDLFMAAYGDALQPNGAAGVPSSTAAPLQFVAWLAVDPDSVDGYRDAASVFAGKAMNVTGGNASSGGYASVVGKLYFERYSGAAPASKPSGYEIECRAAYGLALVPAV